MELIYTSYRYSAQEDFFKEHSDYSWISCIKLSESDEHSDEYYEDSEVQLQGLMNTFMAEHPESFFYLFEDASYGKAENYPSFVASEGVRDYLKDNIAELANTSLSSDIYILIPKNSKITEDDLNDLTNRLFYYTENCEILYYSEPIKLVYRTRESSPITETVKNPIVVFYNNDPKAQSDEGTVYMLDFGMVDDSKGLWTEYAKSNGISYVSVNAWDFYCYRWTSLTRTILINLVIVLIMTVMLLLTVFVVIKLEFRVHAKELALKKIYGYTRYKRFKKLYNIIVVSGVVCAVGVIIIKYTGYSNLSLLYILPLLLLSLIVCCVFISLQVVLFERKNLQGILKGGNI